jgi:vancomycin resistance protein YoaR
MKLIHLFVLCIIFCLSPLHPCIARELIIISSFSTSIEDQEENVKKNLRLTCERLNGYVIMPKSIFSFNKIVGEGSAKNGFVNGRVLYVDEVRYEPGGGLCQASSTLYNALLVTGFTIIERHRHHQPVTYVQPGLDATIKYGKKDLKMKNPYEFNIIIEASVTDKSMLVILKAEKPILYSYEMQVETEEIELPVLEETRKVRNGLNVYVSRKKYSGNDFVDSAPLYKDYFPPVYIK